MNNLSYAMNYCVFRGLVFSFLPLTAADLENWEEDVEEFCSEEIGETWKYNLRPSAEVRQKIKDIISKFYVFL